MATDLQPAPTASVPKHEAFVEKQLDRAGRRIRLLDLAAAVLGFAILTLGYAVLMVLLDRTVQLSAGVRQLAFAGYVLGALVYLGWKVVWPLALRVNPYYAARELERTLPGAKNSLVNWLDLKRHGLPATVQTALGQRAARDLTQANLDEAVSPKQVSWLGGAAFGLLVGLLILFLLGPGQFFSMLSRAFAPFTETNVPTRTQITLLQPEGGDAAVPMGRALSFAVEVAGRIPPPGQPDALRLLYRYNPADAYEEKSLERGESAQHWVVTLTAAQVQNGFWYRISGGDTETPEYRVQVKTLPLITSCEVTYRYRPYLGWPEQTSRNGNLEAHRGTEVTLIVRTNRQVKEGQLLVEGEKPLSAELLADDPKALRFKLVLNKDGKYRVWFATREGERNNDPMPYTIKVLNDLAPSVELKKPGSDIELPANGTLRLEGVARDDFGVVRLTLHQRVVEGPVLQPKPYRDGKSFRFPDGAFPQTLEYKDFVELEKVISEAGQPVGLQPGQVLEYWLEAADGCDFPGPNVARSPIYRVTVGKPDMDQDQQKQERDAAQQDQKQHEKKQDQQHNQQNQQREAGKQSQPPPKDQLPDKQNPDQQPQQGGDQQREREKELDKKAQQLQDKMREQANQPGQPKPEPQQPEKGEPKDQGNPGQEQQPKPGEGKPQGQPEAQQQPQGQGKSDGQPDQQPNQGESKGQGQQRSENTQTGTNDRQPQPQGSAKNDPQQTPSGEPKGNPGQTAGGEPKEPPKSGASGQNTASTAKPETADSKQSGTPQGEPKGTGQQGTAAQGQQPEQRDPQAAARELAKQLFSNDPKEREAAAEKIAEMQRQASRAGQSNDPKQQANANQQTQDAARAMEELAKEAANKDEKTRQAAAEALKKAMDKAQRAEQAARGAEKQQIDNLAKQAQGSDPKARDDAQKQLEQLARNAGSPENRQAAQEALDKQQQAAGGNTGDPKTLEQLDKLAKQMHSGDPKAREDAQQQLEKMAKEAPNEQMRQAAQQALKKQDANAQNTGQGEQATKEQIEKLAQAMQGADPKARDNARQQLEKMARDGKDELTRKQAQEALAKQEGAGQGAEQRAEQLKNALEQLAKQLQNMDGQQREELLKKMQDLARNAKSDQEKLDAAEMLRRAQELTKAFEKLSPEAKQSLADLAKQMQSQDGKERQDAEQKLDEMRRNAPDEAARQAAEALQKQHQQRAENQTEGVKSGTNTDGNPNVVKDKPPAPAMTPDKQHGERASSLTLQSFEQFKKNLTKEMMNDAQITEQDLKDLEALLRRRAAERPEPEKLTGPQRGATLPAQDVRQVQSATQQSSNAQRGGPALPPPELREGQNEFTKKLSEKQRTRDKN